MQEVKITYSMTKRKGDAEYEATMLVGPCDAEFLNKLSQLIKLPAAAEAIRAKLNATQAAVDNMRTAEPVEPLIKPPVKVNLFQHQIRGYNMALLTFGIVEV